MKTKFLNTSLFFVSIIYISIGTLFVLSKDFFIVIIFNDIISNLLNVEQQTTELFTALFGGFIFAWGIIFLLLIIFLVMDLAKNSIYTVIFWGYSSWTMTTSYIFYKNDFRPLLIIMGILYGVIFILYLISLLLSDKQVSKQVSEE